MSSLTDPLGPDLKATLRSLKLGKLTATLPERLTLARQNNMPHADFLQLVLSDEVSRREEGSIALRARTAGLDPAMRTETWDPTAAIRYDQQLWNELVCLRFARRPLRRPDTGPRRRREDTPGHRPGPHRRPPPPHRGHGPRRQAVQAPHRRPPRQHPRSRVPPPGRRRAAHHRRLRPAATHSPPRPPTSTRSSPNATAGPPPWSPPTATPVNGSRS